MTDDGSMVQQRIASRAAPFVVDRGNTNPEGVASTERDHYNVARQRDASQVAPFVVDRGTAIPEGSDKVKPSGEASRSTAEKVDRENMVPTAAEDHISSKDNDNRPISWNGDVNLR